MAPSELLKRLSNGGSLVVAEGYIFELERRCYLQIGSFVPEVVLEHPEVVKSLHEEFVHAGSDVVLAVTYYGHREKMRVVGQEDKVEMLNRKALRIAREVARSTGTLLAGNICNSTIYQKDNPSSHKETRALFKEQIEWAAEEGADLILGETFNELGEAMLALDCIKQYGKGIPAVINLAPTTRDVTFDTDRIPLAEACRRLEEAGAAVVGLNCARGPKSMIPLIREVRKACKGPIACLPVTYRTSPEFPTMQSLKDPVTGARVFPVDLPAHLCSRSEILEFAQTCKEIGVQFVGLCCGACSHYIRIVAEVYGRTPKSSKYAPDISKHYAFGDKSKFRTYYTDELAKWQTGDTE